MNVIHVIVLVTHHFINGEMLRSREGAGREVKGSGMLWGGGYWLERGFS